MSELILLARNRNERTLDNCLLADAGYNFRRLLAWLSLFRILIALGLAAPSRHRPLARGAAREAPTDEARRLLSGGAGFSAVAESNAEMGSKNTQGLYRLRHQPGTAGGQYHRLKRR